MADIRGDACTAGAYAGPGPLTAVEAGGYCDGGGSSRGGGREGACDVPPRIEDSDMAPPPELLVRDSGGSAGSSRLLAKLDGGATGSDGARGPGGAKGDI